MHYMCGLLSLEAKQTTFFLLKGQSQTRKGYSFISVQAAGTQDVRHSIFS